jgi:hypothetical protein
MVRDSLALPSSVFTALVLIVGIQFCTVSVSDSHVQLIVFIGFVDGKRTLCIHRRYRPVSVNWPYEGLEASKKWSQLSGWTNYFDALPCMKGIRSFPHLRCT